MMRAAAPVRIAIVGDYEQAALKSEWSLLGAGVEYQSFQQPFESSECAVAALREFDAIVMVRERLALPRQLLERLPRLKLVVFSGHHHRFIDVETAAARGITVCAAASSGGLSAAPELAWALLLACMRQVKQADAAVRRGEWCLPPGRTLQGKTLGLLGLGQVGSRVARYASAFEMKVLAWTRTLTPKAAALQGVETVDLPLLLSQSDIISVHLPLSDSTRGLIGTAELQQMKTGAVLINTARAAIVDEAALVAALRDGKLSAAGLDVFEQEPLPQTHPLLSLSQVVMTPHIGYVTAESLDAMYAAMIAVLLIWLQGGQLQSYRPG